MVYLASANGGVSVATLQACQAACEKWATPLCVTPSIRSAYSEQVPVTAQITGPNIPADFQAKIEGEVVKYLASLPIGGTVARSALLTAIHKAVPQVTSATLVAPASNVPMPVDTVATPGDVLVTEV